EPDIIDRERFVDLVRALALGDQTLDVGVVEVGLGDGLVEDRGVRGHAHDPEIADDALELARGDPVAPDVVDPDALPPGCELLRQSAHVSPGCPMVLPRASIGATRDGEREPRLRYPLLGGPMTGGFPGRAVPDRPACTGRNTRLERRLLRILRPIPILL